MKISLLVSLLLLSATVFGQAKPASQDPVDYRTNANPPLMVISGEEIRRYPSGNFLDAVNGLFPWVFSQTPYADNFLFVLNGYILQDPSGISLNDIEEVVFSRSNLNGSLYPYSRAGTFYIRTKTSSQRKVAVNFNTQLNYQWDRNGGLNLAGSSLGGGNQYSSARNNKGGLFSSNHLSVATATEKLQFYAGLQWNTDKKPELHEKGIYGSPAMLDTVAGEINSRQQDLRGFVRIEYRFSERVQAGVSGNYFYGKARTAFERGGDVLNGGEFYTSTKAPGKLNYLHTGAFVNWQILPGLRNRFTFEYADNEFDYDSDTRSLTDLGGGPSPEYFSVVSIDAKTKTYNFRNQLDYTVIQKNRFNAGIAAWFNYTEAKVRYQQNAIQGTSNPGSVNVSSSWQGYKQKTTALNPQIYFSYDSLISGYAGYGFLLNKGISEFSGRSKSNPYAGLVLSLRRAFRMSERVTRFDFSAHYGDLTINQANSYWLPAIEQGQSFMPNASFTPIVGSGTLYPNPSLAYIIPKNRMLSLGLSGGFNQDRIVAGVEWSSVESQRIYLLQVPGFPSPTYVAVLGKETQSGVSGYLAATLIEQGNCSWKSRLSVLLPSYKQEIDAFNTILTNNQEEYAAQVGWQNRVRFSKVFVQVNTLLGVDHRYYLAGTNPVTTSPQKFTDFSLNYLLIGYDLAKLPVIFEQLSIFAHARNLVSDKESRKYYRYNSYAGIGINLQFK